MKYCPIQSYRNKWQDHIVCDKEECGLADENGECLIKRTMEVYIREHSFITPKTQEPTDAELIHMAQRIINLPISVLSKEEMH